MIDIGINLMDKQFNKDREEIVKHEYETNIGLIITGTSLRSSEEAVSFVRKMRELGYDNLWCTVGYHPHNADKFNNDTKDAMLDLIRNNEDIVVAVGECGLDYDRMFSTKENQMNCLNSLIDIAYATNKPLFLHERAAVGDFVSIMKKHRILCKKSVVHCFTGTKETAEMYLQMEFSLGLTGWICDDRRNKEVLDALQMIPLSRLMIETDAPYLTPHGYNLPRRNVPDNLHYVAEKIAAEKHVSVEDVMRETLANTKELFKI